MIAESLLPIAKLVAAFLAGVPLGWDREVETRNHGLRTYPIVAMGSTAYVLVAASFLDGDSAGHARLLQGLVTGIGFLGAGAIIRHEDSVTGSATAASVWSTAALGAAIAHDEWIIALTVGLCSLMGLRWLKAFKRDDNPD